MTDARRVDGGTMAEQWQRRMPADFANMTDFMLRLSRIDTSCVFRLVESDGETGVAINFSDGSIYVMGAGPFPD
jgi:hypothetical protein